MVSDFKWQRIGMMAAGLPIVALTALIVVWMVARHGGNPTEYREEAVGISAGNHEGLDSVQLASAELRAAAGIEVEPVLSRSASDTIECIGIVSFNQNKYVKVPPKAEGILRQINVDVGTKVKAGDVLAVVNSQTVGELKASYLKGLIHEEHLRWQVDRYKEAGEAIAAKFLAETKHLMEEQLMDSARIKDRLRSFGLSTAQIDEIVNTKDMSIQLSVDAPLDGVVVERQAVEGEPVLTTTPLFTIADLDRMWVTFNVYEKHLRDLHTGQRVTFCPDGLPDERFEGVVTWISPQVDPLTRTIQLRAEVANLGQTLRANMFGKGELVVKEPSQRLGVPPAAVQSYNGNRIVFVQRKGQRFEVRKVEVGVKEHDFWEVTHGVKPGEHVATVGSFLLKSNLENPEFGKVE